MYQIICGNDVLYDPRDEALILENAKCKMGKNTVGEGSFTIFSDHPYYKNLIKLKSIIEIQQNNEPIFRGRMTADSRDFYNRKEIDLEGVLGFANDTIIAPFNFPGSKADGTFSKEFADAASAENIVEYFLGWVLEQHNSQVEDWQKLKLGNVTVTDPNNYIHRYSENYESTWEIIKSRLFESALGGYIMIRYEADGNYVDYLDKFEKTNQQQIIFGENLMDIFSTSDANETYSAILPLGAEVEREVNSGENYEGDYVVIEGKKMVTERITLKDLPDGNLTDDVIKKGNFVYSKSAKEQFGWIVAPVADTTWDDITTVDELKQKAIKYLTGTAMKWSDTVEIKAFDLSFTDEQIQSFRINQNIVVNSPVHDISNVIYPLTKLEIDILHPQNTTFTLGETKRTFTKQSAQQVSGIKRGYATNTSLDSLNSKVNAVDSKVEGKVSKTDNAQVVKMVNESSDAIYLSNRLTISNAKFGMEADGTIHASGGTIAGFNFDETGLSKFESNFDINMENSTPWYQKSFQVSPGNLNTYECTYIGYLPNYIKEVTIKDGVIHITRTSAIGQLLKSDEAFLTITDNNGTYYLVIDPDTLTVKVVKGE